jgi:hypothetical protein
MMEARVKRKIVIFAFNGEAMCFAHALLNVLDLHAKGHEARLVIEGRAVKQVEMMMEPSAPFAALFEQVKQKGLLFGVCKACSAKMGSLRAAQDQKLTLLDDMSGHPSLSAFADQGYELVTM